MQDEYERAMQVNLDLKEIITKDRATQSEFAARLKQLQSTNNLLNAEMQVLRDGSKAQGEYCTVIIIMSCWGSSKLGC